MLTTHHNISAKALKAAKETLADAIEGTAVLAGVFETLKQISDEGVFPFDAQIMSECDSMMTAMNRLLYEQESKLKHSQMMRIATEKGASYTARLLHKPAEPTLFPQAM